jgi:hypothetical protein
MNTRRLRGGYFDEPSDEKLAYEMVRRGIMRFLSRARVSRPAFQVNRRAVVDL